MFRQLRESFEVARPRSLARMQKSLEDLIEGIHLLRRLVKELAERDKAIELRQQRAVEAMTARLEEMNGRLQDVAEKVSGLTVRESQLRAIATADAALDEDVHRFAAVCDEARIVAHVRDAVVRTQMERHPLPYIIVHDVFPSDFYEALVRGIPPYELFTDRPRNKQQLKVPLAYGPAFSRAIWTFLIDVALEHALQPAIVDKFREPLADWIASEWPMLASNPLGPPMELHSTDGRILLRGRGYRIRPHRDPKWGFITVLLYLPRAGESEKWGTQLYTVEEDAPADTIAPYWIDEQHCRLVVDVPFRRNTALIFLNSHGAHGAFIPEDAEPADLQRYVYQFRIGPTKAAIQKLVAMLPEDRRSFWEGKLVDYLA
jgi:hypothetical protein